MSLDRNYLVWAVSYAIIGMGLGIFMAASRNQVKGSGIYSKRLSRA